MGRTRGALGKKTLEKMAKQGTKSIEKVSTEAGNMFKEAVNTPATMVIEGSVGDDMTPTVDKISTSIEEQPADVMPKKRGRKKGTKNKNTIKDTKDKQNFTTEDGNKGSGADHNNIENYYQIACRDLEKLKKTLSKATSALDISFIKASILCTEINIKRFRERMVVSDEVSTTGKYTIEE